MSKNKSLTNTNSGAETMLAIKNNPIKKDQNFTPETKYFQSSVFSHDNVNLYLDDVTLRLANLVADTKHLDLENVFENYIELAGLKHSPAPNLPFFLATEIFIETFGSSYNNITIDLRPFMLDSNLFEDIKNRIKTQATPYLIKIQIKA